MGVAKDERIASFFQAVQRGDRTGVADALRSDPWLTRARDGTGATGLHHAAFCGHGAVVTLLLDAGADINARDGEYDATPAGWAIHALRERGALLAIEIEDVLFALERGDLAWVERLVTRHPALRTAVDRQGRPLARHPAVQGDRRVAHVFGLPGPDDGDARR